VLLTEILKIKQQTKKPKLKYNLPFLVAGRRVYDGSLNKCRATQNVARVYLQSNFFIEIASINGAVCNV
jgi:hypothetical protein